MRSVVLYCGLEPILPVSCSRGNGFSSLLFLVPSGSVVGFERGLKDILDPLEDSVLTGIML